MHISDHDILTPGDVPNVLVAMNPAALKANLADLPPGATIIVNTDAFEDRNLEKAGYEANPLDDGSLGGVPRDPGADDERSRSRRPRSSASSRATPSARRTSSRSASSPGCTRVPSSPTLEWIDAEVREHASWSATPTSPRSRPGCTSARPPSCSTTPTRSSRRSSRPGRYRNITGNVALAYGLIAAAQQAKLPILYASYPITPASDILHELSKHKNFGVRTLQAEDEIAAVGVAIGAAFAGQLGVTAHERARASTSSPRRSASRSASSCRCVIVDVQRGGPSTGLPTKTEQSDLLLAMYGRHGEAPLPIVAAQLAEPLLRRRDRGGAHRARSTARR